MRRCIANGKSEESTDSIVDRRNEGASRFVYDLQDR